MSSEIPLFIAFPAWGPSAAVEQTLLLTLPFAALVLGFALYCIVDIVRSDAVRHLPKWLWIVVCVLWTPFGGIAYFYLGKETRA